MQTWNDLEGEVMKNEHPKMETTLQEFQDALGDLCLNAIQGCPNEHCIIRPKLSMRNGACTCTPRHFAEELLRLACELEKNGLDWKVKS